MNSYRVFGIGFQSVAMRRLAVVLMYGAFLAAGLASHAVARPAVRAPLFLLSALAFYVVMAVTKGFAIRCSGLRGARLRDERQDLVRDRMMARSYSVLSVVLLFVVGWASLVAQVKAPEWLWRPHNLNEWQYVLWLMILLVSSLPEAFVAWTEPRPQVDEFTESAA